MLLPVAMRVEPGKRYFECRILPTAGDPRGVMHDAQAAQCFDDVQFTCIETSKLLVSGKQRLELWCLFVLIAGQEHPQVLHRRSPSCVVEINDVQDVSRYENVAGMKVGMKSKLSDATSSCIARLNGREYQIGNAFIRG